MSACLRLAITSGEPAGIGPDLVIQLAQQASPHQRIVLADPDLLQQRAALLSLPIELLPYQPDQPPSANQAGQLTLLPVPLSTPAQPGQLNRANAGYVLHMLEQAGQGCLNGQFAAVVTAPVHKGIINQAGIPFTGHTEFFQALTHSDKVVMLLATEGLRVALATTHLPLAKVPAALTQADLQQVIEILHQGLQHRFAITNPRILVAGLNPHAGEDGHLGTEEQDIITPVLQRLRQQGMQLTGPLPADTLFTPPYLQQCDAVLAMYHDQGLPVLKYLGFGKAVNITLGMPIIRTSVDHGTALDLAGSGQASCSSLALALDYAAHMAGQQQTTFL